jgi:hypothetical protein
MNAELEVPEETVTIPEVLSEEQFRGLNDPKSFLDQIAVIEKLSTSILPVDELSLKKLAVLGATASNSAKFAEANRVAITGPLNKQVDEANALWMPIVKRGKAFAQQISAIIAKAIDDSRRAAAIAQQKLIDDAKAKQDEIDRKAKEAREEADRVRLAADAATTIDEAEVLHQQADRLEKKADVLEVKSEQVVTQVVQAQSKTLDLGGSTFSARAPKKTYLLAGWDRSKPLRLTDTKLSSLVGDIEKLPDGLRFLITHSELNPVLLNKSFGVIKFPAPFAEVDDFGGSSFRTKG